MSHVSLAKRTLDMVMSIAYSESLRARGHLGHAGLADFFLIWAPNGWISLLGFSWGYGVVWEGGWSKGQRPKRTGRVVRTGSVWPMCTGSCVHGVPMARVHGVLYDQTNCSGSVGKLEFDIKTKGGR